MREFYAQKQKRIRYETFELFHPDIGAYRFILRQYRDYNFTLEADAPRNAGQVVTFSPTGAELTLPPQSDSPTVSIDVQLGRVGSGIKTLLKQITNWMDEGEFIYRAYLAGDTLPSDIVSIPLANVTLDGDSVVIRAETPNAAGRNVARISIAADFPGEVQTL